MAKLLDSPRNRHAGGFSREWFKQLQACRDEWRAIEAAAEPRRIELLIRIAIDLYPAVLEDEDGFRRFCQYEEIQRHGRTEIMLLRLIVSDDLSDGTARRYGDVILWLRKYGDPAKLRRIGIVKAHQGWRHIQDEPGLEWRAERLRQTEQPIAFAHKYARDGALSVMRPEFTRRVVAHYNPIGRCHDSCRGLKGGFYEWLPEPRSYSEILRGRDFLDFNEHVDWNFANPPWEQELFERIANHAFDIADNCVFLLRGDTMTMNRVKDYLDAGFDIKEEIVVDWREAFENVNGGFRLVLLHLKRGYRSRERKYWLGPRSAEQP